MAIDKDKAFEISEDGLLFEGGAHLSSGVAVPTHTALEGDVYFRTDGTFYKYLSSAWVLQTASGFDENTILTDNFFDVLVDNEGNVLRGT